jgi:hypothetical protein
MSSPPTLFNRSTESVDYALQLLRRTRYWKQDKSTSFNSDARPAIAVPRSARILEFFEANELPN